MTDGTTDLDSNPPPPSRTTFGLPAIVFSAATGVGSLVLLMASLDWIGAADAPGGGPGAAWWLVVGALVATSFAAGLSLWAAFRRVRELEAALARCADAAARMPTDPGMRLPIDVVADLQPMVRSLNHVAELRQTAGTMIAERDAHLDGLRSLGGLAYWQQGPDLRYERIERAAGPGQERYAGLLGTRRWDEARPVDASSWDEHRARLQRCETFDRLLSIRRDADGTYWVLEESGAPRYGTDGLMLGYHGVMRIADATLAHRDRERLALAALRASSEATLLVEADPARNHWRAFWANVAARALFERSESEIGQCEAEELLKGTAPAVLDRLALALAESRPMRGEGVAVDRYGHAHPVALRLEPLRGSGSVHPRAALVLDRMVPQLTSLRERIERLDQLRRGEGRRHEEMRAAASELESFSYTVSHDLRAPLRVVDGFARILLEDYGPTLEAPARDHMNRILSATARMNAMIEALLRLSRLSAQPLLVEPVDLSRLAQQVIDDLRSQDPGRAVNMVIAPGLTTRGDRALLRVVLENLIGNAWKFSARKQVAEIGFSAYPDGAGRTAYCVSDNGAGFDMRFSDRLFGVFQRLHSTSEYPGTGIGLATVQRVVRRHRGHVWAESEPGAGSRFWFTLWDEAESGANTE